MRVLCVETDLLGPHFILCAPLHSVLGLSQKAEKQCCYILEPVYSKLLVDRNRGYSAAISWGSDFVCHLPLPVMRHGTWRILL